MVMIFWRFSYLFWHASDKVKKNVKSIRSLKKIKCIIFHNLNGEFCYPRRDFISFISFKFYWLDFILFSSF